MMLGVSGMMGSSAEGGAAAEQPHESGGASGGSSEVGGPSSVALEETEKGGGGNRWPRLETLALIQIRHDMDSAFRDSSLKGPLWEEVSRKMAELGFQRNPKKCKEKFENVFKYHKRTKDGRSSKPDGKTYRFFQQLEALQNPPPPQPPPPRSTAAPPSNLVPMPPSHFTITTTIESTSLSPTPISILPPQTSNNPQSNPTRQPQNFHAHRHLMSNSTTSSSTSSDEGIERRRRRRGKKRKWKDYFERLVRDIVARQEDMQKRFLDALERRESDRMAMEEARRVQETARLNREHELLVQERQKSAAKDSAVIAFLQKVSDRHNLQIPINFTATTAPPPPPPQPHFQQQSTALITPQPPSILTATKTLTKADNGGVVGGGGGEKDDNAPSSSSSRWPKAEVEALIDIRTSLDLKYQDNGPKGPLWEEISSAMCHLGYSRNAKRCKEKWENINKYYKKVKESNKKRPEDSKTCPYFHQLEAIYRARNEAAPAGYGARPDDPGLPIVARPEYQHREEAAPTAAENNEGIEDEEGDGDDQGGGYDMLAADDDPSTKQTTSDAH